MSKTGESKGDVDRLAFKFENIGPVKEAELELGDLTVIAGANNTGKTYIAYTLYGFLKMLQQTDFYLWSKWPDGVSKKRVPVVEIKKIFHEIGEHLSDQGAAKIFSSSKKSFPKALVRLADEDHLGERFEYILADEIKKSKGVRLADGHIELDSDDESGLEILNAIISSSVGRLFPNPFTLPAERVWVSLFYKALDVANQRLVEKLQSMACESGGIEEDERFYAVIDEGSPRYSKPIKDNIDFTRDLDLHQKKTGELAGAKLFGDIEDMIDGSYKYEGNDLWLISKAAKDNAYKIPMHLASSSARGLLDLYFYMKHVAKKGQLLIIDEPESHLDVNNQMAFAHLVVRCVNAGVKVLITTHSDYIIKELNSLVLLSQDFAEKDGFLQRHKSDYTKNDFLKPESIRAYVCQDGRLDPCKVDNFGMIIDFFDDAIDRINKVYNTLAGYLQEE